MFVLIVLQKSKLIYMILCLLKKTLAFYNGIIHIKLVWNKDQNYYCYNILLEKCLYQLPKNNINK